MPLISEEDWNAQQNRMGLQPVGHPQGLRVTPHPFDPPQRTGVPPQAEMFGQEAKPEPTSGEMWRAAFEQENDVLNVANYLTRQRDFGDPDPNHNPLDMIKGTAVEQFRDRFLTSRNAAETNAIKARIEKELENRRILEQSGWAGFGAMAVASILSPTTILPFGQVYRGYKVGSAAAKTATRTAAWAGGAIGVQEAALHAAQETRTLTESLMAVGGGVVIGGLLGAGASAFASRRLARASALVDQDIAAARALKEGTPIGKFDPDAEGRVFDELSGRVANDGAPGALADAGAAVTRPMQENKLAGAFGLEKAFRWTNPLSRLIGSENKAARDAATRIAEMPMMLEQNKRGIPTGPEGGSVESRIKIDGDLALYRMQESLQKSFAEHRFQDPNAWFAQSRAWIDGNGPGKLSYKQFKQEVTKALRMETAENGIQHPIPEVKKAAESVRKDVFNYFRDEAKKLGLFPEDVDFLAGYVMRRYDVAKILTEHTKFRDILVDWLAKGQAKARRDLSRLEDELRAKQGEVGASLPEIARLKEQITDLKTRWAVDPDQVNAHLGMWEHAVKNAPKKPETLAQWVKRSGGIKDSGKEVAHLLGSRKEAGRIIDNVRGSNLDDMTLRAWEEGFFGPRAERPTIREFLDLLDEDVRAERIVRDRDADALTDYDMAQEFRRDLEDSGALTTTSEATARKMITSWLREQSAIERTVRSDLADDRATLAGLEEQLRRAETDDQRALLQDEIQRLKDQIGDVQSALSGFAERRTSEASISIDELRAVYNDLFTRLNSGHPLTIRPAVVDEQLALASRYVDSLPEGSSLGAIESVTPTGAGRVSAVFRLLTGERVVVPLAYDHLIGRALFDRETGNVLLLAFSGKQVGEGQATGIYHEAVHAKWDGLDGVVRDRLVAHAETLGVLDMQLGTVLRAIGDPTWKGSNAHLTIREAYSNIYRGASDLQDRLNQEAVAHLQELAYARFFTDAELGPVLDDLAELRGDGASRSISPMQPPPIDIPGAMVLQGMEPGKGKDLGEVLAAIRAYHGTPHDFDRFDSRHIGKGEGNQAYGHGLYFAESEGVARWYREELTRRQKYYTTEPDVSGDYLVRDEAIDALAKAYVRFGPEKYRARVLADLDQKIEALSTQSKSLPRRIFRRSDANNDAMMKEFFEDVRAVIASGEVDYTPPGRLYEVRIDAEPEQFLDWDKRVGQQSEVVQKAIRKRSPNIPDDYPLEGAKWLREPGVAEELRGAGVVGIRYLDGNSRGAGEGARNIVVFPGNEHLVTIVAKDGTPVAKAEADDILAALSGSGQQDALGYTSKLDEVLGTLRPTDTVTAETLQKRGVKQAEMQARGLADLLADGNAAKVGDLQDAAARTRVKVREASYEFSRDPGETSLNAYGEPESWAAEGAAGRPKWQSYSLDPSNQTYRETVLHLPSTDSMSFRERRSQELWGRTYSDLDAARRLAVDNEIDRGAVTDVGTASPDFRSGHWSEPNVVAHARTSMLKDAQGRNVFHVDELQSDWGQRIRDRGGRDEAKIADLEARVAAVRQGEGLEARLEIIAGDPAHKDRFLAEDVLKAMRDNAWTPEQLVSQARQMDGARAAEELKQLINGANNSEITRLEAELVTAKADSPGHPLVNTTDQWVNTALRRMIRQAVEQDADYIAIPSGRTVLAYGMGGEAKGIHYAYDQMYPKNLRNILRKMDKGADGQQAGRLYNPQTMKVPERFNGATVFPLTDAIKAKVMDEGQPLFAVSGDSASRAEVSPDLWAAAKKIGEKLKVELPDVAAKSFDEQIDALEKFIGKVELAAQKAGRSASDDMQKLLSQVDELKYFADADPQELEDIANETISKITGTPAGRMINPFDPMFLEGKTGPLQARTLKVPDLYISDKGHAFADFLDDDIERISSSYVRSMAPDVALAREFGDINMREVLKQIQEDADKRSAQVPDGPETKRIQDEAIKAQKDLIAIAKRLRGTYNLGDDPSSWGPWTARRVKELNVLRLMGSVVVSSIPDLLKLLMAHGFRNNVDLFSTFATNLKGARLSMQQAKEMSAGLEFIMSKAGPLWDAFDDFGGYSKFDQTMQAATRKFGRLTLMDQWNSALKQLSGSMTASRILRASMELANGRISPKQRSKLAKSGISPEMAQEIAAQYRKHGGMHGRLWLANANDWDDTDLARRAAQALKAAVRKEADITIVTPGQERPLWTSGTVGSVLAQFRTFSLTTIQRTLIPAMQEADAAVITSLAGMIALGMLSERLKQIVHGKDRGPETTGDWLYAGIANAGILGWVTDVDQTLHKATRGNVSAARFLFGSDRPISRFASQNVTGSLLGPSFGAGQDVVTAFGGATSGDLSQGDIRAMRRLLPYQNLFWLSRVLRAGEQGAMDALGVPERRRMN